MPSFVDSLITTNSRGCRALQEQWWLCVSVRVLVRWLTEAERLRFLDSASTERSFSADEWKRMCHCYVCTHCDVENRWNYGIAWKRVCWGRWQQVRRWTQRRLSALLIWPGNMSVVLEWWRREVVSFGRRLSATLLRSRRRPSPRRSSRLLLLLSVDYCSSAHRHRRSRILSYPSFVRLLLVAQSLRQHKCPHSTSFTVTPPFSASRISSPQCIWWPWRRTTRAEWRANRRQQKWRHGESRWLGTSAAL